MGIQSNKYITTTVDIIRTATTIDIMRTVYTDMVIGIIIEQERHYIRSSPPPAVSPGLNLGRPQLLSHRHADTRVASTTIGRSACDGEVEN
jgi:hypothetical protein